MRAKVSIKLEIIEGEDTGYVLEETNHILNLERSRGSGNYIRPYRVTLDFVTPNILREARELEQEAYNWELEQENYRRGEEANNEN